MEMDLMKAIGCSMQSITVEKATLSWCISLSKRAVAPTQS